MTRNCFWCMEKSILVIASLLFSGLIMSLPIYAQSSCVIPPLGIVSWWPGDGNTQDIVDSNPGTLVNDATFAAGKVGQGFSLDGIDDHIFIGNPNNLKITDDLTIETWVSTNDLIEGQRETVISKWAQVTAPNGDSYSLILIKNIGIIQAEGAIGVPGISDGGFRGGNINSNMITHVAMTYDSSSGENKLYVNGQNVATRIKLGGISTSENNVLIGHEDSFLPRPFSGLIDEVTIYNRALSQTEIQGIFDAGSAGKCKPISEVIGGTLIPIDTTSLLLAGAQSFSWMIPAVLSALGIGLFLSSRKSENS